jgi:hypothetical protein
MQDSHPKDHPLSALLDEIVHETNIVIVIPSGNSQAFLDREEYMPMRASLYPELLFDGDFGIFEGSSACSVLTVGAYSGYDETFPSTDINNPARFIIPINREDPSLFSRIGPGFNNSVKPELLAIGGNEAFDAEGTLQNLESLSELTLNYDFALGNYFLFSNGTCIAAAKVANSIASLMGFYRSHTGNFYRALIVNRTMSLNFTERFSQGCAAHITNFASTFGYGKLCDRSRLLFGNPSCITLFREDVINYDDLHYYSIPIPDSFRNEHGRRTITTTLVFNPPVRASRHDYLAIEMKFYLIRTPHSIDDVRAFFSELISQENQDIERDGEAGEITGLNFKDMADADPVLTIRSHGTVQSARYTRTNPGPHRNDNYFIVVRCRQKPWFEPDPDELTQPYAIIVTIEHENNIHLYDQIAIQVQERALIRQ